MFCLIHIYKVFKNLTDFLLQEFLWDLNCANLPLYLTRFLHKGPLVLQLWKLYWQGSKRVSACAHSSIIAAVVISKWSVLELLELGSHAWFVFQRSLLALLANCPAHFEEFSACSKIVREKGNKKNNMLNRLIYDYEESIHCLQTYEKFVNNPYYLTFRHIFSKRID